MNLINDAEKESQQKAPSTRLPDHPITRLPFFHYIYHQSPNPITHNETILVPVID
jgi:hypothetical protein